VIEAAVGVAVNAAVPSPFDPATSVPIIAEVSDPLGKVCIPVQVFAFPRVRSRCVAEDVPPTVNVLFGEVIVSPPLPPEYCGMFKTPALNVAGPLEPAVVMDWTGTCVVEGVPLICVKGIEGKSAATRAHGANAVAVPQVPMTSWLVCPVAAARASTGVVVELVTLGVSQLSHEPVEKLSTVARDVPHVGQLIVVPLTTIGDDPV
jgi:hypothetical protein